MSDADWKFWADFAVGLTAIVLAVLGVGALVRFLITYILCG